ncbi:MAG: hypothetical protein HY650_15760 [Acidobacteria bacterium]|nr:hypothetical protein [Acidobacteriota bacterium]
MIQNLPFDERGMISAVIQVRRDGQTLTEGLMNAEALLRSLKTGRPHLIRPGSPSLIEPWDSEGRELHIADVVLSDLESKLLVLVDWIASGSEGHLRVAPPFESLAENLGRPIAVDPLSLESALLLDQLIYRIRSRKRSGNERSVTTRLFDAGLDGILLELGGQVHQLMLAAKSGHHVDVRARMSHLLHAFLVLMVERGLSLEDLVRPLAGRAGLDEPVGRGG